MLKRNGGSEQRQKMSSKLMEATNQCYGDEKEARGLHMMESCREAICERP